MTTTLINALYGSLAGQMGLRKSRLESLCVLVVAVLVSRTVNLSHLSGSFPSRAEIASNYRRLQRFFEQVCLDYETLARVIVRVSGLGQGPWLLASIARAGSSVAGTLTSSPWLWCATGSRFPSCGQ